MRNAAAASHRTTGLLQSGRRDSVVNGAECLPGFRAEGESKNWIEVAEEIPELGDSPCSRGREEADGVEMTIDVAEDDFDVRRGGVVEPMTAKQFRVTVRSM